jgi:pimeloyl-ACP methyl ester carboxylesterase
MTAPIPLLLLPGLVNDERVWRRVMTALGAAAQPVVGDVRTHDTMRALAAAVLERAPDRFAVVGLSMGGYCALEMLRQAPQRILGLALVDTSARPDTPESKANRDKQIERARGDYPGLVGELLGKWIHPGFVHDPDVAEVARDMALENGPDTFARQQRAIMSRADSRPLLAQVRCPAIVVAGRQDTLIPLEVHEELASGIAGATLSLIDDCGHLAPLEQPAAVADALRGWLRAIA